MSKANIVPQQTFNFTDDQIHTSLNKVKGKATGDDSYKKLMGTNQKDKYFNVRETMAQPDFSSSGDDMRVIPVRGKRNNKGTNNDI